MNYGQGNSQNYQQQGQYGNNYGNYHQSNNYQNQNNQHQSHSHHSMQHQQIVQIIFYQQSIQDIQGQMMNFKIPQINDIFSRMQIKQINDSLLLIFISFNDAYLFYIEFVKLNINCSIALNKLSEITKRADIIASDQAAGEQIQKIKQEINSLNHNLLKQQLADKVELQHFIGQLKKRM